MFSKWYTYLLENPYHLIFLSLPVVLVMIWAINLFVCQRNSSIYKRADLKDDIAFQNALQRLNKWLTATTFWMIIEYLCVILPFVANSIVVYLAVDNEKTVEITVYSIISRAFVVFGYAIKPQLHKQCYRRAYALLDSAINEYFIQFNTDQSKNEYIVKITKALESGENEVNASYDL